MPGIRGTAVATWIALGAAGVLALAVAGITSADSTNRPDCGFSDDPAPDFTLTDENPTSATYGQPITLSDLQGKAVFVMFIRSSCGHCQTLSTYLDSYMTEYAEAWGDDVVILLVNMAGYEEDLPAFCTLHDLPTVQDDGSVADDFGAALYWNYTLRTDGRLHTMYYALYLPTDEQRLITDIETARGK